MKNLFQSTFIIISLSRIIYIIVVPKLYAFYIPSDL